MNLPGVISLTTDFGLTDPYVASMKGVILSINPAAKIIDISHHIEAGSIAQAAIIIREAYPFFPEGTIHVAVVDPGVGGKRRPILVKIKKHVFVGPDNGLFWPIIETHAHVDIFQLTESRYFLDNISHTFHGRDIFAPVAAHLSCGVAPRKMGPMISDPVKLEYPGPKLTGDVLSGQVIRVDQFGNLLTNIRREDLARFSGTGKPIIRLGKLIIEGVRKTYGEVSAGEPLALIGSSGYLEIAVNQGRASDVSGLNREDIVGMEIHVNRV